jgi:hypothetical protein
MKSSVTLSKVLFLETVMIYIFVTKQMKITDRAQILEALMAIKTTLI